MRIERIYKKLGRLRWKREKSIQRGAHQLSMLSVANKKHQVKVDVWNEKIKQIEDEIEHIQEKSK